MKDEGEKQADDDAEETQTTTKLKQRKKGLELFYTASGGCMHCSSDCAKIRKCRLLGHETPRPKLCTVCFDKRMLLGELEH